MYQFIELSVRHCMDVSISRPGSIPTLDLYTCTTYTIFYILSTQLNKTYTDQQYMHYTVFIAFTIHSHTNLKTVFLI